MAGTSPSAVRLPLVPPARRPPGLTAGPGVSDAPASLAVTYTPGPIQVPQRTIDAVEREAEYAAE
ncbi:hypothetical protein [Nocardia fluminea]|uniref:hypothetical protein n=1 Tax=Nocardia fluminea TaxID=134984 RepID=UPI003D0DCEC4